MTRLAHLDGLRGIAVLLVLGSHASVAGLNTGGVTGVTLFLVLSGYLITSLLLRERERTGGVDLLAFAVRRVARLVPLLWLVLAVTVPLLVLQPGNPGQDPWPDHRVLAAAALALVFATNVVQATGWASPYGHTWTLALEEQFYLLWPTTFRLLARSRTTLAVGLLVAAGASVAARVAVWLDGDRWQALHGPLTSVAPLLVGAALALRPPAAPRGAGRWGLVLLVATTTLLPLDWPGSNVVAVVPATAAGVLLVLAAPTWLTAAPLTWLGVRSYAVYLWHMPLLSFWWFRDTFAPPWTGLAVSLVSVVLAALTWPTLEKPLADRARAWSRRRADDRARRPVGAPERERVPAI